MKTLSEICEEVIDIEEGLMYGTIPFYYDNLMSAMKPGHPMEILDEILATIFWDVQSGKEPPRENIEETVKMFRDFKNTFKVKEMNKPIRELNEYLKQMDSGVQKAEE